MVHQFHGNDLQAALASLDENLVRIDLREQLWSAAVGRRKLPPEIKHGGDHGNQHTGGKTKTAHLATFSEDTAKKLGVSQRHVQAAIRRDTKADDKENTP